MVIELLKAFITRLDTSTYIDNYDLQYTEFLYLKPRKSHLQTFEAKIEEAKSNTSTLRKHRETRTLKKNFKWSLLKPYLNEYCNTSSIHSLNNIANNKLRRFEKVLWLVIVVFMIVCCITVYYELINLYHSQRVQTTVADSVYPIFLLPFPSVGICLRYRIDWHRLRYEAAERFLPPNAGNQTLHTFYKFFESMADVKFYTLYQFAPLFDPAANMNLSLLDGVDVLKVLEYLADPCGEVFGNVCKWRYRNYNCCEILMLERTELGYCYIFNSIVSQKAQEKSKIDTFYPYHNSYSGEGSGLEVMVQINENKMNPSARVVNGVYIMIKKNDEWFADVKFINHNTFTKLALTAQITETDKLLRRITPSERGCLFEDETDHYLYRNIPGFRYWHGNCRTRCHQEYVLKYCKCNFDLLFPDHKSDNFTSCKASDFKCIYEHANVFSKETYLTESKYIHDVDNESMQCNCLSSCNQLEYQAFYTSFPLERLNATNGIKSIHLDVHYESSFILKYRTAMKYTFVELLAYFGGVIGLFLGASLLSGIELLYFSTFGLYIYLHKQLNRKISS